MMGWFQLIGLLGFGSLLVFAFYRGIKQAQPNVRADPPALRSMAHFALQPWGPWESLNADARELIVEKLDDVIADLNAAGEAFEPVLEDEQWMRAIGTTFELWFFPTREADRWSVWVKDMVDDSPTRTLLLRLDTALRKLQGGAGVRWHKNEAPEGAPNDSPLGS